ncbi:MAG: thioredoxin family protein [Alphaproteobacteria bacterium]|nr:MAG: thioredoxin family protein [Alphaproteobacteria bacterium]
MGDLSAVPMGVGLRLDPGWKTYGPNPGPAGLPARLDWGLSDNVSSSHIAWPPTMDFEFQGIHARGYQGDVLWPMTVRPKAVGQPINMYLRLEMLVCKDVCIPQSLTLPMFLTSGQAFPSSYAETLDAAHNRQTEPASVHNENGEGNSGISWILAFGLALLGGLILNLMPCVLPVLSLKLLAVLGHGGGNRRDVRWSFLATAAGIVFSFWLLAGFTVIFKWAGGNVGWGLHFQNPIFLIGMILVLMLFAANLWGLFEFRLPQFLARSLSARHNGMLGAFLTGCFATLLATPCSAPFLGTAVGFALASGAWDIITIFTALGLGLAAPWLIVAAWPRLATALPRPGAWMIPLRRVMGVGLAVTALWLGAAALPDSLRTSDDPRWRHFDERAISELTSRGAVVFVNITADWCLTCLANKKLVLERPTIRAQLFDQPRRLVAMQGDWTHRDEGITAYLLRHKRYGIPFSIVYGPGAPEGIILPEFLHEDDILKALNQAKG